MEPGAQVALQGQLILLSLTISASRTYVIYPKPFPLHLAFRSFEVESCDSVTCSSRLDLPPVPMYNAGRFLSPSRQPGYKSQWK